MSAVGRVAASVVSGTNENTLALANFNVDFTLIKLEAPKEYKGLGTALSRRRLENAEQGPLHRTARKLGALFEQIIPPIKTLVEAYGRRVSEISTSEMFMKPASQASGPFASHAGIDGTSIYAAATSGTSALAVHLLACMLARAWSSSEAIALWVELVAERKKDIIENSDPSQIHSMGARVAAQQDVSRADLAKWDASARAWLLSADEVKLRESIQFKLITKDCGMLVSSLGGTYESVIDVWTEAMSSLQRLILGVPQRISKGALLIGLSSWHIYPDMNIVGPTTHVRFRDPLVGTGGVVTIGLQSRFPETDNGVKWSLSLSHLRYYGEPVEVETITGANSQRISMIELHLVALGSLLGSWGMVATSTVAGAEFFVALRECLNIETDSRMEARSAWLHLLWDVSKSFLDLSPGVEKDNASSLIAYGRRRGQNFLSDPSKPTLPMFGLADPLRLASLSIGSYSNTDTDEESAILDLRFLAQQSGLACDQSVIRYRRNPQNSAKCRGDVTWEYATAVPRLRETQTLNDGVVLQDAMVHTRWIDMKSAESRVQELKLTGEECERFSSSSISMHDTGKFLKAFLWQDIPKNFEVVSTCDFEKLDIRYENRSSDLDSDSIEESESTSGCETPDKSAIFDLVAGNQEFVSLWLVDPEVAPMHQRRSMQDFEVTERLRSDKIVSSRLRNLFESLTVLANKIDLDRWNVQAKFYTDVMSLNDLAQATALYKNFPGATVSMAVASRPLHIAKWAAHEASLDFTRANKFACIAMFESGTLDIDPKTLTSVMAMSSGNSIYVVDSLLQDPVKQGVSGISNSRGIRRILGNLDRPGVVFLVPPQAPLIRVADPESWRLVNHVMFNNKVEESFADTSLHLSFTDYELPLSVSIGAVDAEAVMLESLISVYDRERWVADLDILGNMSNKDFFRRFQTPVCSCASSIGSEHKPKTENIATQMGKAASKRLVAIDNWDELLDPPERLKELNVGVVRGGNNWHARLALMSVSVQKQCRTVVLPPVSLCTECGSHSIKNMADFAQILIM